uniref:KIB1-4 beta-propeller domain-containing protein n=1 Tax=Ananas comosus var. bracteatus TaxID=296719 RepID=A0A6V7PIW0_ANACO|nr:unnamed protein product [Ananas comosus var. bracteatus]
MIQREGQSLTVLGCAFRRTSSSWSPSSTWPPPPPTPPSAACAGVESRAPSHRARTAPPTPQLPFLLLGRRRHDLAASAFSLATKRTFALRHLADAPRSICVGSCYGWLFLFDPSLNLILRNPFTGDTIRLPPLPRSDQYLLVHRAILSSDPSADRDFLVVLFANPTVFRCFTWQNGDNFWTVREYPPFLLEDIVFYEDRRCIAIGFDGGCMIFDFATANGGDGFFTKVPNLPVSALSGSLFLVESAGNVWLVMVKDYYLRRRRSNSMSVASTHFPGFEGDSIYFTKMKRPILTSLRDNSTVAVWKCQIKNGIAHQCSVEFECGVYSLWPRFWWLPPNIHEKLDQLVQSPTTSDPHIFKHFTRLDDYLRARFACKKWSSNLPLTQSVLRPQPPLLMLPSLPDNTDAARPFVDIPARRGHLIPFPLPHPDTHCFSTSHGWLFFLGHSPTLSLFNPVTRQTVYLPSLYTLPNGLLRYQPKINAEYVVRSDYPADEEVELPRKALIRFAVLSADPSADPEFEALILLHRVHKFVFRFGNASARPPRATIRGLRWRSMSPTRLSCSDTDAIVTEMPDLPDSTDSYLTVTPKAGGWMLVTRHERFDAIGTGIRHFRVFLIEDGGQEALVTVKEAVNMAEYAVFVGPGSSVCVDTAFFPRVQGEPRVLHPRLLQDSGRVVSGRRDGRPVRPAAAAGGRDLVALYDRHPHQRRVQARDLRRHLRRPPRRVPELENRAPSHRARTAPPTPQLPFLLLGRRRRDLAASAFSLATKRTFALRHLADAPQSICVGSCYGWLLLLDPSLNLILRNPFTGDTIRLPPLPMSAICCHKDMLPPNQHWLVHRAILSSDPSADRDFLVVLFANPTVFRCFTWQNGDNFWTVRNVWLVVVSTTTSGEDEVEIYRLDLSGLPDEVTAVSESGDLGSPILFLERGNSMSVASTHFPGFEGDTIYFTKMKWPISTSWHDNSTVTVWKCQIKNGIAHPCSVEFECGVYSLWPKFWWLPPNLHEKLGE